MVGDVSFRFFNFISNSQQTVTTWMKISVSGEHQERKTRTTDKQKKYGVKKQIQQKRKTM